MVRMLKHSLARNALQLTSRATGPFCGTILLLHAVICPARIDTALAVSTARSWPPDLASQDLVSRDPRLPDPTSHDIASQELVPRDLTSQELTLQGRAYSDSVSRDPAQQNLAS